jgi:hypothetical protein
MRRIALALILVAAVVGIQACAADAPTAPKTDPSAAASSAVSSSGVSSSAVSVQLSTTGANPMAGACPPIEALVPFHGAPVGRATIFGNTNSGYSATNDQLAP